MNKSEALKIMAALKTAYPAYYHDATMAEAEQAAKLWQAVFDAEPYELVSVAVIAFISTDTKGFPPSQGQLKDHIYGLLHPDELTEQQAWNIVSEAINGAAYSTKGFDDLPQELKGLVGSNRQLVEWGQMDAEKVETVVASNIQRSYREMLRKKREHAALPPQVLATLKQSGYALLNERMGSHED